MNESTRSAPIQTFHSTFIIQHSSFISYHPPVSETTSSGGADGRAADGRVSAGPHPIIVFLVAAFMILPRLDVYGMTFAEARILDDATAFFTWLGDLVSTRELRFGVERLSPVKLLAAAGILLFDRHDPLVAIRIFPALLYAAAAALLYAALRRPRGPFAAAAAAGAIVLAPPLFGLSAQASDESILMSLTLIGLLLASSARAPTAWARVGLVAGLAAGAGFSGIVLILAVPLWALLFQRERMARRGLAAYFGALLVGFLLTWPRLVAHPRGLVEQLALFVRLERPPLLHFGLRIDGAPWHYAPVWLLIGVPPLVLLFALRALPSPRPLARLFATYLVLGLGAAIAAHGVLRDGVRHLLPFVAVLAAASGLGLGRLARARPGWRPLLTLLLFLPLLLHNARFHPAESFYLSEAIGGPAGAAGRGLPITSSGDILTDEVLRRLPAGRYAVLPGAASDRPLDFASPRWRIRVGDRASRLTGRSIVITTAELADQFIVLGAAPENAAVFRRAALPLVERGGVMQAALIRNPARRAE